MDLAGHLTYGSDPVVDQKYLTSPQDLSRDGLLDDQIVVASDKSLD